MGRGIAKFYLLLWFLCISDANENQFFRGMVMDIEERLCLYKYIFADVTFSRIVMSMQRGGYTDASLFAINALNFFLPSDICPFPLGAQVVDDVILDATTGEAIPNSLEVIFTPRVLPLLERAVVELGYRTHGHEYSEAPVYHLIQTAIEAYAEHCLSRRSLALDLSTWTLGIGCRPQ